MSTKSPLGTLKQFLGYLSIPEGQEASSEAIKALPDDALLKQDGTQDNFTTGIAAAGTAAEVVQNSMPEILKDVQTTLNANGLALQCDQVMVTNVTVLRKLPTETRQIGLTFNGELTADDAATIVRRAALELK